MKEFFFRIAFFLVIIMSFSSCSLAFLASKKQAVSIQKDSLTKLMVNDSLPILKNDKYIFNLSDGSVQLKLINEGFKDEYKVLIPYKKNGLYYGSFVTNTLVVGAISGGVFSVFNAVFPSNFRDEPEEGMPFTSYAVAALFGIGSSCLLGDYRLYSFEKNVDLKVNLTPKIFRDSTMKEIYLNKVAFDVSKTKFQKSFLSAKNYYKAKTPTYSQSELSKGLKLDNSIFSDEINKILTKNGFVDTSGLVLKSSYKENLFLNTTITEFKVLNVDSEVKYGLTKLTMKSNWDILDIYKNTIYSDTIEFNSGEFRIEKDEEDKCYKNMINDALESGLYKLMSSKKFSEIVKVSEKSDVESLDTIEIIRPTKVVTNLQEAVESSATIKTKSGHGSGFLITENGYLITNYHVIADSTKLEVILNDGTKHKATIVQVNKESDLAFLKIEKNGFVPFVISDTESIGIGKEVFAIGTPKAEDLSQTLSKGIISSVRKQANGSKIIQTDASVNGGNSGGPLVDKDGKLLGVVNAKIKGFGVEGISFAIPASMIMPTLKLVYK